MARKTSKRKAAARRGASRGARRSTRSTRRPAKRARPASRARTAPRRKRKTSAGALRTVAIPPGEAADRPSLLEGLDVEPPAPTERDASEWDGLDAP